MRFFVHQSGATLQTPDVLDDIFQYEFEATIIEEVDWSAYLHKVKTNYIKNFLQYPNMTEDTFIHRKYLPEGTYPEDCISTTEEEIEAKRMRHMLNARVLAAKYGHKPNPARYKDREKLSPDTCGQNKIEA